MKIGKVRYIGASSMKAWEFSKALNLQRSNGWTSFLSLQDTYNLLMCEEEREMPPLCADEGVGYLIVVGVRRRHDQRRKLLPAIRMKQMLKAICTKPLVRRGYAFAAFG